VKRIAESRDAEFQKQHGNSTFTPPDCEMEYFLYYAINEFGTGLRPMADSRTFASFKADYIRQCVRRAYKSMLLDSTGEKMAVKYLYPEANPDCFAIDSQGRDCVDRDDEFPCKTCSEDI